MKQQMCKITIQGTEREYPRETTFQQIADEYQSQMENDIVLHGDFRRFVQRVNAEDAVDYIHIATDVEGGPQKHWPVRYIQACPFKHLYFSWCHILYLSHGFLTDVAEFMARNDSIHYEFLLPTMAYNGNYLDERMPDTFYHPVKDLSIVDWGAGDMPQGT